MQSTQRAVRALEAASAIADSASPIGTRIPVAEGSAKLLYFNTRRTTDLSLPAAGSYELTADENARLLHLIAACAQVTTHRELFLLVQGELQFFLPHDTLIAAWGDFRSQNVRFDVISSLAGMRTNRVSLSACDTVALAKRLHKLWDDGGRQAIVLNKPMADREACHGFDCEQPCVFPGMSSLLVHGTRNTRDDSDNLYIALRASPFALEGHEKRLRMLVDSVIHQLDIAYGKVAALQTGAATSDESPPAGALTARETEVTDWLCQGKTNAGIGQILNISVNTVKNHVHRIFEKLDASNRTEAVAKYRQIAEGI